MSLEANETQYIHLNERKRNSNVMIELKYK